MRKDQDLLTASSNSLKKIFLLSLAALVVVIFQWAVVRADDATAVVSTTVRLNSVNATGVSHTLTLNGDLPEKLEVPLYGMNEPKGLKTVAGEQSLTASVQDNKLIVEVPSNRRSGQKNWKVTISYQTDLVQLSDNSPAAQLAGLLSNFTVKSQTVVVRADLDLGLVSTRGPKPFKTSVGVGEQIINYQDKDGPIDKTITLLFGLQTTAELKLNTTLKNTSWWWNNVELTLPPDTNQQRAILDSIEPAPSSIRLDRDGNMLAAWRIWPLGQKEVSVSLRVNVFAQTYELNPEAGFDQIDQVVLDRYTSLTDDWQPVPDLQIPDGAGVSDTVRSIFDQVVAAAVENEEVRGQLSVADRSAALELSDQLVGSLRSAGIPARSVLGLLSSDGNRILESPRQHAWVEANIPGTGWMTLDPWMALFDGGYGASDYLHIALGLWGIEDDAPPVPLESASVSYAAEFAELAPIAERGVAVSGTKYVVLPLVSVFSAHLAMPPGGIEDDLALVTERGGQQVLGSLAPLQNVTYRSLRFGGAASSSEKITAATSGTEGALAESMSNTSYIPMVVIGVLVVIGILIWVVLRHRSPKEERYKPDKKALTWHDEAPGGNIEEQDLMSKDEPAAKPAAEPTSDKPTAKPPLVQ